MGGDGGQHQMELAGLRAVWSEAERRLYPLATTVPELYMIAVRMVRAVADGLGDVSNHGELVQRWAHGGDAFAEAQTRSGLTVPAEIPVEQIVGAAFAIRDREVAVQQEEEDRRERVRVAREGGESWAVLHERGDISRGLADPYQCIELHLSSGLALVSTVEQEPSTAATNYVASVVEMDSNGGQVINIDVAGYDDRETDDAAVFADNRSELRTLIERPTA